MKSWIMSLFWLSVWGGNQFTAQVNHFIAIPSPASVQFEKATAALPADWQTSPRTIMLPGHDGVTGTGDDFVARCGQGRLRLIGNPRTRDFPRTAASRIEARSDEVFPSKDEGRKLMAAMPRTRGGIRWFTTSSTHPTPGFPAPDPTGIQRPNGTSA